MNQSRGCNLSLMNRMVFVILAGPLMSSCSGSSDFFQSASQVSAQKHLDSEIQNDNFEELFITLDEADAQTFNLVRGAISKFSIRTSGDMHCWEIGNGNHSISSTSALKVKRAELSCKLEIIGFSFLSSDSTTPIDMILTTPIDSTRANSFSDFSNGPLRGQLSVANPIVPGSGGTLRLNLVFAEAEASEVSMSFRACDGGKSHGESEQRTRFESSQVTSPSVCRSEVQERTCKEGAWTDWSGTFSHESCQAKTPDLVQVNGSGATVCGQPLAFFNERGIQTGGTASLEGSNTIVFTLVSDIGRVNSVRVNVSADCNISVALMPGMQSNMCYRHNDSTCSVGGFVSGAWRTNCESPVIWQYQGSQGQIGSKQCSSGSCQIRTQAGTLLWSGSTDIQGCHLTCHNTSVIDLQGRPLVATSPNRTCQWNGGNVR